MLEFHHGCRFTARFKVKTGESVILCPSFHLAKRTKLKDHII